MTDDPLPSKFHAAIGGYTGISINVEILGDSLHHSQAHGHDPHPPIGIDGSVLVTPSPEQWATFRKALDRAGFWDWDEGYSPTDSIMDGTSWAVEIQWGDRSHESHGSNAYPSKWDSFRRALRKLLGGLKFN